MAFIRGYVIASKDLGVVSPIAGKPTTFTASSRFTFKTRKETKDSKGERTSR